MRRGLHPAADSAAAAMQPHTSIDLNEIGI